MNYGQGAAVSTIVDVRNRIMNNPDEHVLDKIRDLTEIDRGLYAPTGEPPALGSLLHAAMGAALGVGIVRGIGAVLDLGSSFQNKLETAAMGIGILKNSADQSIDDRRQAFRLAFIKAAYDAGYFKRAAPLSSEASAHLDDAMGDFKQVERLRDTPEEFTKQHIDRGVETGAIKPHERKAATKALTAHMRETAAGTDYGDRNEEIYKRLKLHKTAEGIGFSAISVSPGMLLSIPQAASNALMLGGRTTGAALGALDAPTSEDEREAELEATRDLLRQRLAQAKSLKAESSLRSLLAKRMH